MSPFAYSRLLHVLDGNYVLQIGMSLAAFVTAIVPAHLSHHYGTKGPKDGIRCHPCMQYLLFVVPNTWLKPIQEERT
jgi:hypothetical protein